MNKKCQGCGALLQDKDNFKEGYIRTENYKNSKLCERCFRIRNYGEYKKITKTNKDFIPILKKIGETNDLVVLVVDLFQIQNDFTVIKKYLKNCPILLVLTKRDVLPRGVYDKKLIDYMDRFDINYVDVEIISSEKNLNFDSLMDKINKYKTSKNVYVIGYTNAGKSTMINKIIYNYSDLDYKTTTSMLPSTTLNTLEVAISDDLMLIDTPGILDENSIVDVVDAMALKRIMPKKEIKPISLQIKTSQTLIIDKYFRMDLQNNNNIVIYVSSGLNIERYYKDVDRLKNLEINFINVKKNEDIVINGFGFIKFMNDDIVTVYVPKGVKVYTRPSLI